MARVITTIPTGKQCHWLSVFRCTGDHAKHMGQKLGKKIEGRAGREGEVESFSSAL